MYKGFKVTEVTNENESKYLDGIVELENVVYENMIKQGKEGQLFTTGKEDISEYIHSSNDSVFIVTMGECENKVVAATYITKGQVPFTYNDVTKYFKCSDEYMESIKQEFKNKDEYIETLRKVYIQKITAFVYARDEILKKYIQNIHELSEEEKNNMLLDLVNKEIEDPTNNFHEKSQIREDLNKYMSMYMDKVYGSSKLYENFYWVDMDFLKKENGVEANLETIKSKKYNSTIMAYDKILQLQKYNIHDKSGCENMEMYYSANPGNTIELDTYITSDEVREYGLARIIVFEGIKRVLEKQKMNNKEEDIFLVSTLHRDNLSSKYVSEFFGLKDNLFVTRRTGRDREVHICRIRKNEIKQYLDEIEKKLIVLYNYNPNGIKLNYDEKNRIMKAQLDYEIKELDRLEKLHNKKYDKYIEMKKRKISKLRLQMGRLVEDSKNIVENKISNNNAKDISR